MTDAEAAAMDPAEFDLHLGRCLDRLRPILIARHGVDVGGDLHAEVTAYAWENRERLAAMENPTGYLYRVGQSRARRYWRWRRRVDLPRESSVPRTAIAALGNMRM